MANHQQGRRILLERDSPLPPLAAGNFGTAPALDLNGSPVFFGSTIHSNSVHPGKIAPHLAENILLYGCRGIAHVVYGTEEIIHTGRFDVLPFDPQSMELVRTQEGHLPPGRRPVQGGYEENGALLYHALAEVDGVKVPGKCGEHLVSGFPSGRNWISCGLVLMLACFICREARMFLLVKRRSLLQSMRSCAFLSCFRVFRK